MRRAGVLATIGVVVVIAAVVGGWLWLSGGDEPEPVGLSEPATSTGPVDTSATAGSADGQWRVVPGENTFVGYRVQEKLAFLDAPNDAVGRTGAVEGTLTVAGDRVTEARIQADLRQLTSDQDRRDNAIRRLGLESERWPEAVFELTEPMTLSAAPAPGRTVSGEARGRLTVHGQTGDVTVPVEGRWDGATAEVAGSVTITMSDFGITPPRLGPVETIQDEATVELRLTFEKA